MKVKIKRLNADGISSREVIAWAVVSPGRDVQRELGTGGRVWYPMYSRPDVNSWYYGYYHDNEIIWNDETPTQVLPEWGPVCP